MHADTSIHSILLVQTGALGDTVLQLRIAEALRRVWPAARIGWLGRDTWHGIAQRCTAVDDTATLDALHGHRLFEAGTQTPADLAAFLGQYDLIVNGLAGPDSVVMQRLQRAARRAAVWYEPRPAEGVARHVSQQWLEQLAEPLNVVQAAAGDALQTFVAHLADGADAFLEPLDEDIAEAAQRLRTAGVELADRSRLVVVHPGSGGRHKCYPIERYAQLLRLLEERGMQPVMMLGPAEVDRWGEQVGRLVRQAKMIIDPPVEMVVALARLAAAYVGNDSGPTHVAAAAGAATLALFGPTDPVIWKPLGPRVTVLQSQQWQRRWDDLAPEELVRAVAATSH